MRKKPRDLSKRRELEMDQGGDFGTGELSHEGSHRAQGHPLDILCNLCDLLWLNKYPVRNMGFWINQRRVE